MAHFKEKEAFFVKLEGWYQNSSHIFIAMEYFPHGDLNTCVTLALPESEVQIITYQLAEALEIMHLKKFIHRDLKPSNVFVVFQAPNWWVKLGDFGVSKRIRNDSTTMHTSIETDYTAPEIRGFVLTEDEASHYTNAVDMWSLGCLVHWMLTQRLPLSNRELYLYCNKKKEFPRIHLDAYGSTADALDFLAKLIQPLPQDRLTASDALKHGWPQELKPDSLVNQELPALAITIAPKEPAKNTPVIEDYVRKTQADNWIANIADPDGITTVVPEHRGIRTSDSKELEYTVQADGPFGLGLCRGVLAGREAAGVGLQGQDRPALGLDDGGGTPDADGPFGLGLGRGVLAGREAAGVGLRRQDRPALGLDDGGGAPDADGPFGLG
ncbi:MAG: hypothetical protein Q9214_002131 [Letrouitia sp. 1 TL-2023]